MIRMMMLTSIIDLVIFLFDPNTIGMGPKKITPPIFDFFEEDSVLSIYFGGLFGDGIIYHINFRILSEEFH